MPTRPHHPAVRPATSADGRELQALARRTIDSCYRGFLGDEAVDQFIDSGAADAHVTTHLERGGAYCLVLDGEIVAFSVLDGSTVDLMMVDPAHHRRGLGRVLLRHAEETLFARYVNVRLETFAENSAAMSFYAACGWVPGDRLEDEGPARVEYTKDRADG